MKTQRTIVYLTSILVAISIVVYYYCVFLWEPSTCAYYTKWNTFFSNISLALFGSALLSLIVAYLSYCDYKIKSLERFKKNLKKVLKISGRYSNSDCTQWFNDYCSICEELGDSWAEIWFLVDPKKHRLYLKSIVDFYNDFILLTQDEFLLLDIFSKAPDGLKESVIGRINKIVFFRETFDRGIVKINYENNRLTSDKEHMLMFVDEIYRNRKLLTEFPHMGSLVTKETFNVLNDEQEKYVEKICQEIDKHNSCNIQIRIPKDIAENLVEAGYISDISYNEDMVCELKCKFLLYHYFELKERLE